MRFLAAVRAPLAPDRPPLAVSASPERPPAIFSHSLRSLLLLASHAVGGRLAVLGGLEKYHVPALREEPLIYINLIYINMGKKIVRIITFSNAERSHKMLKMTRAVAAAAVIVTATPLLVVSSPAQSENLKLAQVEQPKIQIGPGGVTVAPKTKPKCRTVTTTTETSDGRKVTKREQVCDEGK